MNNLAKKYAQALFESVQNIEDQKEIEVIINNFVAILIKENKVSQVPQIENYFISFWNNSKKVILAEVVSVRKLDQKNINSLKEYIKKRSKSDKVELVEKIDQDLKGGIILRFNNKIVDLSIKNKLVKLNNILNN